MAKESLLWGAERIQGELLKLGIQVAKRTIPQYIRSVRATPLRGQTWATFLKHHAGDSCACDCLPVVDLFFRPMFLFFIIALGSRRVAHFGVTRHPTEVWAAQHLREATPYGKRPRYLIRDNDAKLGTRFDNVANKTGIEVQRIPFRAPRANAICERFLGSLRRECLDHLLIFGQRQLYHVMKESLEYFNRARPHQGIDPKVPEGSPTEKEDLTRGNIIPFRGMPASREDQEGPERENREGKARPGNGKIIGFPVLGGRHPTYRRVA